MVQVCSGHLTNKVPRNIACSWEVKLLQTANVASPVPSEYTSCCGERNRASPLTIVEQSGEHVCRWEGCGSTPVVTNDLILTQLIIAKGKTYEKYLYMQLNRLGGS